jgi:polyisoprenoid-binding protein YceI
MFWFTWLALASAEAAPTTYALAPEKGRLYVVVRYDRDGLLARLGHDHVVVAQRYTGSVTWDPADLSACSVKIDLPVTGLVVDPGSARSWEGLDGETPAADKTTITENFRGPDQLDAARFPKITYRSTSCRRGAGDLVAVTGVLTMHGVEQDLTVPMRISADGATLAASGAFDLDHGDFGMEPFRALGGSLRNDERLSFVVDVRGVRP